MLLHFYKMNGAGNDFVMLDNRDLSLALTTAQIEKLCDRHRGIGADGLLCVEPATDGGDFKMRYYNADGGEAEMCGNGARCYGRFVNKLHEAGLLTVPAGTQIVRLLPSLNLTQVEAEQGLQIIESVVAKQA